MMIKMTLTNTTRKPKLMMKQFILLNVFNPTLQTKCLKEKTKLERHEINSPCYNIEVRYPLNLKMLQKMWSHVHLIVLFDVFYVPVEEIASCKVFYLKSIVL